MSDTIPEEIPSSSSSSVDINQDSGQLEAVEAIKQECKHIFATRYVDPNEAIRKADELCSKHENISVVHFTRGHLLTLHCATLHDEDDNKIKFSKDAIDSFQRAVQINPDVPDSAYYLARAYFQWARLNREDYHCVVQECERALNMDALSQVSRTGDSRLEKLKSNIENLISSAKAAQVNHDLSRFSNVRRVDQKLDIRMNERKLKRTQDFIRKTGEYWRELSYDEKCRILDVKVKDVESFYGSWKNKNSQALSVLTEAVDMYREKGLWVTWICCFCKKDRKTRDYDVWSSIEKHIDNHFDDPEPRLNGSFNYDFVGNFDSLDIIDGVFVLHSVLDNRPKITREVYNDPIQNNKFLYEWLAKEDDAKLQLELWEKRNNQTSETGLIIFEKIVKLKKEMKAILEKNDKDKPEAEEDMQTVTSDDISILEEKIVTLKREAVCLSACDYREIIVPLLKCFIQASLEADAQMAELIKDETPKDKNVPTNSKTKKKKKGGKSEKVAGQVEKESEEGSKNSINENNPEQQERELKEGTELEAREESNQEEQEEEFTILIGTIPVTLKAPKSKEKKIARQADLEIARETAERQPENVDDVNEGWTEVTQKKKRKDVAKAEQ